MEQPLDRPLDVDTTAEPGGASRPDTKYLETYLDDHVTGATVAIQRVRRMASAYGDTPAGPVLRPLAAQLEEEREFLVATAGALGIRVSRYKVVLATVAERVGRLKPNGHLLRPSPLSALLEVELLRGAITGKLSGWQTLGTLPDDAPVDRRRLEELQKRAEDQFEQLTELLTRLRPRVARPGSARA
jgi:hypothetical protein